MVPTLVRDDGTMLTEFSAIATWLARTNPEKGLLPTDPQGEAHAVGTMAYVEGTVHEQGFARMVMPQRFELRDIVHQTVGLGQCSAKRLMSHAAGGNR